MKEDQPLREHLLKFLEGKGAHANLDAALEKIPPKLYGKEIEGLPYTLWQLLEHIRLTQADILDYIINPHYKELKWPDEYWPKEKTPPQKNSWKKTVETIKKNGKKLKNFSQNPKKD